MRRTGVHGLHVAAGLRGPNVVVGATLAALLAACGGTTDSVATPTSGPTRLSGAITVLAAASLTESFGDLGRRFRAAHPGVDVTFSFDASSTLVQQVKAGAPADVLATADEATMQQAVAAGAVGAPGVFAHNRLAIIVARGNPNGVRDLADLARPDLTVVLCAPEVPCGRFGARALERAGVSLRPRSLEPNVKGVVSKVTLGEADAGIVYVTDVKAAAGKADGVDIPAEQNVVAAYPIATLRSAPNPSAAAAFVDSVRSDDGRAALAGSGFDP